MTTTTANGNPSAISPLQDLTLYTDHNCPFAHRAHIVLAELGLRFEEVLIDLNTPRPAWYLALNPRGLVPIIRFTTAGDGTTVLTESRIVAGFLMDAHASPLLAATALERARQAWIVQTWEDRVANRMFPALKAAHGSIEQRDRCAEWLEALEREIEPLLPPEDGREGRFFGGSEEMTAVEVMIAPFLLRTWAMAEDGEVLPGEFRERLEGLPRLRAWMEAIRGKESVMHVFNGQAFMQMTKGRLRMWAEADKKKSGGSD
nr:glutathione s-transferase omega-1 [Quercus suber]